MTERVSADFLIVGSGIAGLRAALELAPHGHVLVLTKSDPREGSTGYAQGGIAAAVGPDDSPALHASDTVRAGAGLCDEGAVSVLVNEGIGYVRELIDWGAVFDRHSSGELDLAREGAHAVRRVLHARDATGREISRVLGSRLSSLQNVELLDHAVATQAIVEEGGVAGIRFIDDRGNVREARARATLLATGGAGQVYRDTTNPTVACGDGVAIGYFAGARVTDLEFVQFHPTVLNVPNAPRYLLSEALRGEGARLINEHGEPFMHRYEPDGELAARDRVARAMLREVDRTGSSVYLSMSHLPADEARSRFPQVAELCRRVGLDLATDRLPVGPAAHYLMGGLVTDLDARTSIPRLFAAGEVAATGVHGANRLASNSLLEGLVFGARAGRAMRASLSGPWPMKGSAPIAAPEPTGAPVRLRVTEDEVRDVMWRCAAVFRSGAALSLATRLLEPAGRALDKELTAGATCTVEQWRTASLLTVSRLIVRAALDREESRGAHWRSDFPETDDLNWKRHVYAERSSPR